MDLIWIPSISFDEKVQNMQGIGYIWLEQPSHKYWKKLGHGIMGIKS